MRKRLCSRLGFAIGLALSGMTMRTGFSEQLPVDARNSAGPATPTAAYRTRVAKLSVRPASVQPEPTPPGILVEAPSSRFPEVEAMETSSLPVDNLLTAPVMPIDLASALRLAGVQNPQILLAQARTLQATALQQYAAAQILPSINLGTNYDQHIGVLQQSSGNILQVNRNALYVGAGTNAVAAGTVSIPGVQYNLNVSDSIFGYLSSRQNTATRGLAAIEVRNDMLLEVTLAYGELLRSAGRRAILIAIRDDSKVVADITTAFARSGVGRQADADRAVTELRRRQAELLNAEAQMLTTSARLARLISIDTSTRLHPMDNWVVPRPIVPELIPLNELLAIAMMQRPELQSRRSAVRMALLELRGAKMLPFSPQFLTGMSAGEFGGGSNLIASPQAANFSVPQEPRFGTFDPRFDVDVITYWSLRNVGVGNHALIRAASARMQQSNFELLNVLNLIRNEVTDAYVRTHAKFAEIAIRERAVRSGLQGYAEDLRRIQAAEGRPIEVLNNLRLLRQARLDYLDTIINYNEAHVALYVSLGRPPATFLIRSTEGPAPNGSNSNEPKKPRTGGDHAEGA